MKVWSTYSDQKNKLPQG